MHYYKFNIPDWTLHTAHLTPAEEGVYLRLVNFYYDTEEPIPKITHPVIRRLRLGDHVDMVGDILEEFFFFDAAGDGIDGPVPVGYEGEWRHKRCDKEVKSYHSTAERSRRNGSKGGRPRASDKKEKPKITQPVNSGNPDITLTKNYKPLTNNHKKDINTCPSDDEQFAVFWSAYPRKEGKPAAAKAWKKLKPNQTLIDRILRDIQARIGAGAWELENKQFIPHASTYLNGKRFTDEITPRSNPDGINQPGNRKLSLVERAHAKADKRAAERAAGGGDGSLVASYD